MSGTASIPGVNQESGSPLRRLWRRDLDRYPTGSYRIFLLAIVVLANIVFTWTVAAGPRPPPSSSRSTG